MILTEKQEKFLESLINKYTDKLNALKKKDSYIIFGYKNKEFKRIYKIYSRAVCLLGRLTRTKLQNR